MAYNDSGEIAWGSGYNLGEYSFSLERTSVPGSSNDQITAICRQGNKSARKSVQIQSSAQIEGWYVEANETEATVYIKLKGKSVRKIPVSTGGGYFVYSGQVQETEHKVSSTWHPDGYYYFQEIIDGYINSVAVSKNPFTITNTTVYTDRPSETYQVPISSMTVEGKPVYYRREGSDTLTKVVSYSGPTINFRATNDELYATAYGLNEIPGKELMVGRFAIGIEDAGGYPGGGGDWDEPGDWDPDWDPEDPTTTLHIEVVGALSGRHNDPLNDTSYSYIPPAKDTVKSYGCGGDGGHGGGGGAGASTVLVHKIATNKANHHEVIALARRHGYGSGGGKGGRGGDGIILIYY